MAGCHREWAFIRQLADHLDGRLRETVFILVVDDGVCPWIHDMFINPTLPRLV